MNKLILGLEVVLVALSTACFLQAIYWHSQRHQEWLRPFLVFFKPVNDLTAREYQRIKYGLWLVIALVVIDLLRNGLI
ncbi:hypothetical protein ACVFI8_00920 [Agarivorans sp. MS3-6]|uniref:hypothetical protein n=1 Tax=Agarivorans sp. TSD2052 TaxID=2937286 RepID=UPI00200DB313|nr:hypothetical protein [Agarivorans sp. TSD2052]UPW20404.1 hypothetical protein M0C34_09120 [Agarivorans sp. TSD2052]